MKATQLGTGAPRELLGTYYALAPEYRRAGFGCPGRDWMPFSAMLGALDAPDVMPAGAMNSTEWTNGRGQAVASTNEITREEL